MTIHTLSSYLQLMLKSKPMVILFGLCFGLFWAEVLIRLFGLAPVIAPIEINKSWGSFYTYEYKNIRYLPRPGSPGINTAGFKDREFVTEKSAGTYRILMIGDSLLYGLCYNPAHIPTGERVSESKLRSQRFFT